MRFSLALNVASLSAAALLVSGCGGSEGQPSAVTVLPSAKQLQVVGHRKSWMLREATSEDLLYAVGGCGGTCVMSYPNGKLVGTLNEPQYGIQAICSDKYGNVFLSNNTSVLEYAHGGTTPIATLQLPGDSADGCSVDPQSGDLAIVFRTSGADVAVFPNAEGTPNLYDSHIDSLHCGFDNSGNLFVNGFNGHSPGFSELPAGTAAFNVLSIDSSVGAPGQVQWDGTYITYESTTKHDAKLSQLAVDGSSATVVGTTKLEAIRNGAIPSWIYGTKVVLPFVNRAPRAKKIGVWKYPAGGSPTKIYKKFGPYKDTLDFQGVTVSVATNKR